MWWMPGRLHQQSSRWLMSIATFRVMGSCLCVLPPSCKPAMMLPAMAAASPSAACRCTAAMCACVIYLVGQCGPRHLRRVQCCIVKCRTCASILCVFIWLANVDQSACAWCNVAIVVSNQVVMLCVCFISGQCGPRHFHSRQFSSACVSSVCVCVLLFGQCGPRHFHSRQFSSRVVSSVYCALLVYYAVLGPRL